MKKNLEKTILIALLGLTVSGFAAKSPVKSSLKAEANAPGGVSMASNNNKFGFGHSVNEQTGEVSLNLPVVSLTDRNDLALNLSLSYDQNNSDDVFRVGTGWSYNLTYATKDVDGNWQRLHMGDGQVYVLDTSSPSGLKDFKLQDVNVTHTKDGGLLVAYDDGNQTEQLNSHGQLMTISNNKGDDITFTYAKPDSSDLTLTAIHDNMGNDVTFSDNGEEADVITVTKSHKESSGKVDIGSETLLSLDSTQHRLYKVQAKTDVTSTDPKTFKTSMVNYTDTVHSNLPTQVVLPTGGTVDFTYGATMKIMTPQRQTAEVPVVSEVSTCASINSDTGRCAMPENVTQYEYGSSSNAENYSGYPKPQSTTDDALLKSNDNSYHYTTTVTRGDQRTTTTYNHLHLITQITTAARQNDESWVTYKVDYITYPGEDKDGNMPNYKDLPVDYQNYAAKIEGVGNLTPTSASNGAPMMNWTEDTATHDHWLLTTATANYDCGSGKLGYGVTQCQQHKKLKKEMFVTYDDQGEGINDTTGHYGMETSEITFAADDNGVISPDALGTYKQYQLTNDHKQIRKTIPATVKYSDYQAYISGKSTELTVIPDPLLTMKVYCRDVNPDTSGVATPSFMQDKTLYDYSCSGANANDYLAIATVNCAATDLDKNGVCNNWQKKLDTMASKSSRKGK